MEFSHLALVYGSKWKWHTIEIYSCTDTHTAAFTHRHTHGHGRARIESCTNTIPTILYIYIYLMARIRFQTISPYCTKNDNVKNTRVRSWMRCSCAVSLTPWRLLVFRSYYRFTTTIPMENRTFMSYRRTRTWTAQRTEKEKWRKEKNIENPNAKIFHFFLVHGRDSIHPKVE